MLTITDRPGTKAWRSATMAERRAWWRLVARRASMMAGGASAVECAVIANRKAHTGDDVSGCWSTAYAVEYAQACAAWLAEHAGEDAASLLAAWLADATADSGPAFVAVGP